MVPNVVTIATAAFVAGILCADFIRMGMTVLILVAVAFFSVALWQIIRRSRFIAVSVLGLFFVTGIIRFDHAMIVSPWDVGRFAEHTVGIQGTVAELPEWRDIDESTVRGKYVIAVQSVSTEKGRSEPSRGLVLVTLTQAKGLPRAAYGDFVTVYGRLAALHDYQNPGQLDNVAAMKLQGITAKMATSSELFVFTPLLSHSWQAVIAGWRQSVAARISQAMAPSDAAVLTGILFGGYSGINPAVVHDFASTGLVHILSVSGTHIALVAGVAMWLGGWLGLRRTTTAGLAACSIVLYALFAGLTPPVVRSMVMGLAALSAVGLGRDKNAFRALVLTALVMIAYQPGLVYNISFQLSFGATAGIVLLYEKTVSKLSFLPRWLAGSIAVTLNAQMGVLPFIAWYFDYFPLSSFLANIIVVPPIEALVVIGLAGSLVGAGAPLVGKFLLVCSAMIIGVVVELTAMLASLPGCTVYLPACGLLGGAVYYGLLAWVYGFFPRRVPRPQEVLDRWPVKTAAVIGVMIVCGFIYLYYPRPVQVHFIDVGQGDSTLVITPHGRAVLIDCGGESSDFDVGARVVVPYLRHYGVTALDYLILTHGHQDHAGGAAGVAMAIPVRHIILAREEFTPADQALLRVSGDSTVSLATTGQRISLDGVEFTVEHAADDSRVDTGNEASNVIRVRYSQESFLITGDLGPRGEEEMLSRGIAPGQVLKVAHHGAKSSTSAEFLRTFAPKYAVISVGYDNKFGHPHRETLQRLAARNVRVYRTDRDGAVVFTTDGRELKVETFVKTAGLKSLTVLLPQVEDWLGAGGGQTY